MSMLLDPIQTKWSRRALDQLREMATFFKMLGNYNPTPVTTR